MNVTLSFGSGLISDCEAAWTTTYATTANTDADHQVGTYSVKLVCGANLSGKLLAYKTITSKSLLNDRFVTLWLKSTITLTAGQIQLLLDHASTPDGVSSVEVIDLPTLTANTWKFCIVGLANPVLDGAIVSVGVWMVDDVAACSIYVDQVYAGGSETFTATNVIGFAIEDWEEPRSLMQEDLAGNTIEYPGHSFRRKFSVDLAPIISDDGTLQNFLAAWFMSPTKNITYGTETVQVARQDPGGYTATRVNGLDFALGYRIEAVERNSRTTFP